jgi:hypothetical protein
MSPGTVKTMVETISQGMKVLRNGELIRVPPSFEARSIDFGTGPVPASVIRSCSGLRYSLERPGHCVLADGNSQYLGLLPA